MPRYPALRFLAEFLKVVAALIALVGIVGLIVSFSPSTSPDLYRLSRSLGTFWMIGAVIFAFPLWCYAEVLQVFMDIEENTRETLEKIALQGEAQHPVASTSSQDRESPFISLGLREEETPRPEVPPETLTVLTVASEPKGAAVYIDGRRKGETPQAFSLWGEGEHLVEIKVIGHKPYEQRVRCNGTPIKIDIRLEPRQQPPLSPAA
jgi:hypothetical protein